MWTLKNAKQNLDLSIDSKSIFKLKMTIINLSIKCQIWRFCHLSKLFVTNFYFKIICKNNCITSSFVFIFSVTFLTLFNSFMSKKNTLTAFGCECSILWMKFLGGEVFLCPQQLPKSYEETFEEDDSLYSRNTSIFSVSICSECK